MEQDEEEDLIKNMSSLILKHSGVKQAEPNWNEASTNFITHNANNVLRTSALEQSVTKKPLKDNFSLLNP